jgi:hypothetical protein
MSVYAPSSPQLGKNAIALRVAALRTMNEAEGPQYKRYDRSGARPAYQVETVNGEIRPLDTREVPAYVLGQADMYPGVRAHVQEALDAALANPDVGDRESLMQAVLEGLDERCGNTLKAAAAYFTEDGAAAVPVAV